MQTIQSYQDEMRKLQKLLNEEQANSDMKDGLIESNNKLIREKNE